MIKSRMTNNKRKGYLFLCCLILSCALIVSASMAGNAEGAVARLGSLGGLELPARVAVDAAGSIYVTETQKNRLVIFYRDGSLKHTLYGLSNPLGVAVDASGRIYIGNAKAKAAQGSVDVYSPGYQYLFSLGSGKGEFLKPNTIAVHSSGLVYVADSDAHMIKIYNSDGSLKKTFGTWGRLSGSLNGEFNFPAGIAIDESNGEVYVSDLAIFVDSANGPTSGARVQVFDLEGVFKRSFGTYGTGDGKLIMPLGVAYSEGKVYVTDAMQNVVQVFDATGNYLETIYDLAFMMNTPIGIAIGGDNRIFIASSGTKTVEVYGGDNYTFLTVDPGTLSFEAQSGKKSLTQELTIGNTGKGSMTWSMAAGAAWITMASTSGSLGAGASAAVAIGIDATALAKGTYTGTITVNAEGAEEKVSINVEVIDPPVLEVSPSSLFFKAQADGDVPASQSVSIAIKKDTTGAAVWSASSGSSWLSISPSAGTSAAVTTAAVTAKTTGMAAGTYAGTISISSEGAIGSPADVTVTLELISAGNITVQTNLAEAGFSISGPASYHGSGQSWSMTDAPAGQYSISFNKVRGFVAPVDQTFSVVSGKTTVISGNYRDLRATKKVIAGLDAGLANPASVKVLNTDGTAAGASFTAFTLKYGAQVAAGDIDGDGIDEIIVGAGASSGNTARVKIFKADGTAIPNLEFIAFASSKYGANVAAGDVDGDGIAEIVVGTGTGKGNAANVRVFKVIDGTIADTGINVITDVAGGGVPVACGDLDGDGIAEVITGIGQLSMQSYKSLRVVRTWSADATGGMGSWKMTALQSFSPFTTGTGVVVAAGDIDGDGSDEILAVEGLSSGQRVRAYSADGSFKGLEFKETGLSGILSITAGDTDGDGMAEIILGAGPVSSSPAAVKVYRGDGGFVSNFLAFSQKGGVNVALGKVE